MVSRRTRDDRSDEDLIEKERGDGRIDRENRGKDQSHQSRTIRDSRDDDDDEDYTENRTKDSRVRKHELKDSRVSPDDKTDEKKLYGRRKHSDDDEDEEESSSDVEKKDRRRRRRNSGSSSEEEGEDRRYNRKRSNGRKSDDDDDDEERNYRRRREEIEESGREKERNSRRRSDDREKMEKKERERDRDRDRDRRYEDGDRKHRSRRDDDGNAAERDKRREREGYEDGKERQRDRERDEKKEHRRGREDRNGTEKNTRRERDENEGREERHKNRDKSPAKEVNERGGDVKKHKDSKSQKSVSGLQDGNVNVGTENLGRSGGIYLPPFRLAQLMQEEKDKSSDKYQRLSWDALRKSINGLVNKVNASNIQNIIPELFAENLIKGRGLFCRSCMKSQMASPGFTDVFAALVAIVNTRFPDVGELLLKRIVLQLKRAYKRNDKPQLLAATKFIAHLVNQQVAHEIIALELLTVLLENPTDDSVEVAVGFVTECGSYLQEFSPQGLHGIFERFRGILHEGEIDKRVQFLIEGLFAIRKAKFQGYPAIRPELDLVKGDQLTHELSLEDQIDPEVALDIFKPDPQYEENEKRYEELKRNILGDESSEDEDSDEDSDDEDDEDDDEEEEESMQIKDETETNLVNLRRTIYLTIMSSVDFEEAGHKLLKIKLEPGQEMELCIMLLECCSQERTYLRYYGLLGQRFCMINKVHQENFEKCFVQQYSMIHRLETNKLRNVAKFFAHLLGTDALPWHVLAYIRLTEEDTTSSSRIFIKILFQELSEHLGIRLLNERLTDPMMLDSFESIFPRDNPKNSRFAINFFTSIGLGGITENLREYLKNMPRLIMQQQKPVSESESESGSSSSSGSELESSSSDESESEKRRQKRRRSH